MVSPLQAGRFKDLFRGHPAGVAVVGLRGPDGGLVGLTVTSLISVSAEPPILAFSIASTSSSWPALRPRSRTAVATALPVSVPRSLRTRSALCSTCPGHPTGAPTLPGTGATTPVAALGTGPPQGS